MINRILNSLFMGFIFISILDFLYFIGLKLHYFDFYKIDEYFNVLFFDNQNFLLLGPLALIVGYLLMYSKFAKIFIKTYILIIIISCFSLYEPVGKMLGENVFLTQDQRFKLGSTTFSGELLYTGRTKIYIYRKDLKKTIKLSRDEVTNLTAF